MEDEAARGVESLAPLLDLDSLCGVQVPRHFHKDLASRGMALVKVVDPAYRT